MTFGEKMSPTPRQRRSEKTRQTILDAARRIIARDGIRDLSMREIARQIDYSPAGLYEYFDSKEEIIQTLCAEGHARLSASLRQVDESLSPAEYLQAIGLAYIEFALNNPEHYLLMFTNVPAAGQLEEMLSEGSSFPILLQGVQRGIDAGVFRARPGFGLYEMAYAAWALVHGVAMLRITYLGEFPLDFTAADREVLRAFNLGLQGE
jgi:AcrR family transcriptional regulator